jgi:hypothetical protein
VYNHLPHVDPTRSLDARRGASGSEQEELRRLHREHVAVLRARRNDERSAAPTAAYRIPRPVAAILGLVGMRR